MTFREVEHPSPKWVVLALMTFHQEREAVRSRKYYERVRATRLSLLPVPESKLSCP